MIRLIRYHLPTIVEHVLAYQKWLGKFTKVLGIGKTPPHVGKNSQNKSRIFFDGGLGEMFGHLYIVQPWPSHCHSLMFGQSEPLSPGTSSHVRPSPSPSFANSSNLEKPVSHYLIMHAQFKLVILPMEKLGSISWFLSINPSGRVKASIFEEKL